MSSDEHLPATLTQAGPPAASKGGIAPAWHTVVLIVVLLGFSLASAGNQADYVRRHGRMPAYLLTLAWEWILTAYVTWGLHKRGLRLLELVGGRWQTIREVLADFGVAAIFWIISVFVLGALGHALRLDTEANMRAARDQVSFLFPQGATETVLWAVLSVTAGFCEEVIFRGYLQTQLARASGALWVGIAAQAIVFGGSHAYEGWQRMIIIAIWGSMFGVLAVMRRSLRPGMLAHGFHNFITAMLGRSLLR